MEAGTKQSVFSGRGQRMFNAISIGFGKPWTMPSLLLITVAGSACFGAAMGTWRGGMMPTYGATKLPLAMLATGAAAMLINCLLARILGLRIGCAQSLRLTVVAMAWTSTLLLALSPVAWWLSRALPAAGLPPGRIHDLLCAAGVVLAGAAGLAGARVMWQALGRFGRCPLLRRRVFVAWLAVFAGIGSQVTWSLRPFVGTSDRPIEFLRKAASDAPGSPETPFDHVARTTRHPAVSR